MIERLLRLAAVAIAVAALLDPPLIVAARQLPRLAIMLQRPGDPVSLGVRERLTRDLRADFEVAGPDREAAAAVVIGREYPDRADAFPPRTSTVTLDADPRGGTAISPASGRRERCRAARGFSSRSRSLPRQPRQHPWSLSLPDRSAIRTSRSRGCRTRGPLAAGGRF